MLLRSKVFQVLDISDMLHWPNALARLGRPPPWSPQFLRSFEMIPAAAASRGQPPWSRKALHDRRKALAPWEPEPVWEKAKVAHQQRRRMTTQHVARGAKGATQKSLPPRTSKLTLEQTLAIQHQANSLSLLLIIISQHQSSFADSHAERDATTSSARLKNGVCFGE